MAKANLIAPFPADVDRVAFGHWLSGFADGEGCFHLSRKKDGTGEASFILQLRMDDIDILHAIQSYWMRGAVYLIPARSAKIPHPSARYSIARRSDLANVIVPHFIAYPLRAKKRRDFVIWADAVALLCSVSTRKPNGDTSGAPQKWQPGEKERFEHLLICLREQREYLGVEPPVYEKPKCIQATLPLCF